MILVNKTRQNDNICDQKFDKEQCTKFFFFFKYIFSPKHWNLTRFEQPQLRNERISQGVTNLVIYLVTFNECPLCLESYDRSDIEKLFAAFIGSKLNVIYGNQFSQINVCQNLLKKRKTYFDRYFFCKG